MQLTNAAQLKDYRSGCTQLDWIISRVETFDYSDHNGRYYIGEFKGNMPYRMIKEIEAWFAAKVGEKFVTSYNETDGKTFDLSVKFSTGSMKSNANKVQFYISYCGE
jgi:hypothetical protein